VRFHRLCLVGIALVWPAAAPAQSQPVAPRVAGRDTLNRDERAALTRLKPATIREITTRLAASDMEGRGTAQAGGD